MIGMWKQHRTICYYYHITVTVFFCCFKVVSCLLRMFQARQEQLKQRYLFKCIFKVVIKNLLLTKLYCI